MPFLSDQLYLKCEDNPNKNIDGCAGAFAISIVNPITLTQGAGIDSTISINLYIAGDEDYQFAMPANRGGTRALILTPGIEMGTVVPQGDGGVATNVLVDIFKQNFEPLIECRKMVLSRVCFGEEVTNLLDLLHRFQQFGGYTLAANVTQVLLEPKQSGGEDLDYTFNIVKTHALARKGSMTYKIFDSISTNNGGEGIMYATNRYGTATTGRAFDRQGTIVENWHIHPCLEVSIPYYSEYPYIFNDVCVGEGNEPNKLEIVWQPLGVTSSRDVQVYGAVGDDYSFGWFRGPCIIRKN
jgi:hypothetical protein